MFKTCHPRRFARFATAWRRAALAGAAAAAAGQAAVALAAAPHTDTRLIDKLVEQFTGHKPGTPGGARGALDPRLRLRPCSAPLALDWHGNARHSVTVRCPDPPGWRIFVNLSAPAGADGGGGTMAVRRGETVAVAIRGRGFTVQRQGEAQGSGAVGEWIAVRTEPQTDPVRARIERPGLVVIPLR